MRGEKKRLVARTAALGVGLAILAIFMLLPSAAARPGARATAAATPDLSTMPKIKSYLRSLGMNPRGLVIQRGERNYAGPDCPGAAWSCTTATKVVQISSSGDGDDGENRFVCNPRSAQVSPTNRSTNTCAIVQGPAFPTLGNANNSAKCDIETHQAEGTISQTCFITQNGKKNTASARLVAKMGADDTTQEVFQTISVRQISSGSGGNTFDANEGATLSSEGGTSESNQDVHQLLCANQIAAGTGTGPNVARAGQTQSLQVEKQGAGIGNINQNTDATVEAVCSGPAAPFEPIPGIDPPHDGVDCAIDVLNSQAKEYANACARIQQVSGSGKNTIRLVQANLLEAEVKATAGTVNITQGNPAPETTGTDATLDQKSSGLSQIFDGGLTRYDVDVDTGGIATVSLDQTDTGPRCCAGGHQLENPGNDFLIGQAMSFKARVDGELVNPNLGFGFVDQFGRVVADCETSGTPSANGGCVVNQLASNNADSDTRRCGPSASCHVFIQCTAFGGYGGSFFALAPLEAVVTGNCLRDDELD